MGSKWYEAPSAPTKESPEVRIGKLGISITIDALKRMKLDGADRVELAFDSDTHRIGLRAGSGKQSFKIAARGRSASSKFIAAGKFYEAFGISADSIAAADGKLKEQDGIPCIDVNAPKGRRSTASSNGAGEPKLNRDGSPRMRPGRRPKTMADGGASSGG